MTTSTTPWFDRPMRWAQLTLVENDPVQYDLNFWLDYFKRIKADATCLSAGGCVAYYPTEIPYHYRSQWLGDGDPFGDLVAGCRELGMVVVGRSDPHAIHQDAFAAHPEWVAIDREGNPRRHWAQPELWVTCALGPYNFEFMTEVHREIMARYMLEGIFSNRWAGHGICYCASCRANFQAAAGMDLPRRRDPQDPAYRQWYLWRQARLFELWDLWDAEIRAINPAARFIANSGGGALSTLDMKTIGARADILFADRQARHGTMAIWSNGKNGKEYRATLGNKPIGGIFSVGVEERYRWKDSVQSPAEIQLWIADGIANGLRPWFTKFGGVLYDQRWLKPVEEAYRWQADHESYLRNTRPVARVALVYSQQTAAFYGGEQAHAKVEDHTLGWYHALIEARIPFEMVHDGLLDAAHVDQFKTLILPNIAALSDAQCQQLRDFVGRGGSLIATFESSRYDEAGQRRANFGLADLFGVDVAGEIQAPMQNSYLRLEVEADGGVHPLLAGFSDTERIINGAQRLPVKATVPFANPPLTLIPSYPDLPMEEVYPRADHTGIPEVYLREVGAGRIVYFPWDIDRTFWEVLCVDHGRLLANAVDWATNEDRPVIVTGPGVLDVTVWEQANSMTVHLVNLTNAMMMKGPVRELIAMGPHQVRVQIPTGKQVKGVQLLRGGNLSQWQVNGHWLQLSVPSLLDHEIVAVDWV